MSQGWMQRLRQFEESHVRYRDDPLPGQAAFRYRPGTRPVLISAPHGACHWRQGRWKREEVYTAALAHLLGEQSGAHALYTVRRICPDPNFEDESDYKRTLAGLLEQYPIRLVLDLHRTRPERQFGLELGTINSHSCPDYESLIIQEITTQHFDSNHGQILDRLWINRFFKGGARQRTVTRFASEQCGVNAAQIEINAHQPVFGQSGPENGASKSDFTTDPIRFRRTIKALINIILAV